MTSYTAVRARECVRQKPATPRYETLSGYGVAELNKRRKRTNPLSGFSPHCILGSWFSESELEQALVFHFGEMV